MAGHWTSVSPFAPPTERSLPSSLPCRAGGCQRDGPVGTGPTRLRPFLVRLRAKTASPSLSLLSIDPSQRPICPVGDARRAGDRDGLPQWFPRSRPPTPPRGALVKAGGGVGRLGGVGGTLTAARAFPAGVFSQGRRRPSRPRARAPRARVPGAAGPELPPVSVPPPPALARGSPGRPGPRPAPPDPRGRCTGYGGRDGGRSLAPGRREAGQGWGRGGRGRSRGAPGPAGRPRCPRALQKWGAGGPCGYRRKRDREAVLGMAGEGWREKDARCTQKERREKGSRGPGVCNRECEEAPEGYIQKK